MEGICRPPGICAVTSGSKWYYISTQKRNTICHYVPRIQKKQVWLFYKVLKKPIHAVATRRQKPTFGNLMCFKPQQGGPLFQTTVASGLAMKPLAKCKRFASLRLTFSYHGAAWQNKFQKIRRDETEQIRIIWGKLLSKQGSSIDHFQSNRIL